MGNRTLAPANLEMWQYEQRVFAIEAWNEIGYICGAPERTPVVLTDRTLRFVVFDDNDPPVYQFKIEGAGIVIGEGSLNYVAYVTVTPTESATANTELHWILWDVTTVAAALANGAIMVRPALTDAPP